MEFGFKIEARRAQIQIHDFKPDPGLDTINMLYKIRVQVRFERSEYILSNFDPTLNASHI